MAREGWANLPDTSIEDNVLFEWKEGQVVYKQEISDVSRTRDSFVSFL